MQTENFLKKYGVFFLIVILGLSVFFRLYQLRTTPPGLYPDEAMNGNNALEVVETGEMKVYYPENNGREGLYANIQAVFLEFFKNEPWALRAVSAIFGILTVLGLYLLTKELLHSEAVALIASFFLSVSFWHVNFSRIGFRAIMAPFFFVWGAWLLWIVVNRVKNESGIMNQESNTENLNSKFKILLLSIISGLIFGLGIHSYIAYRIMPLVLLPAIWIIFFSRPHKIHKYLIIALFGISAIAAAWPLLNYYYQNPQDFLGRTSQISVFAAASPMVEIGTNALKNIGMFFWRGDYNWRHNLAGAPQLWWPIAILFALGIGISFKKLFQKAAHRGAHLTLLLWLFFGLLPSVFSAEGIPHALRSLLTAPVAMIFAALGLMAVIGKVEEWLEKKIAENPDFTNKLIRIRKELIVFLFVFFFAVGMQGFNQYFMKWNANPHTAEAFNENHVVLGNYLNRAQQDIKKYVIINEEGVDVRGYPMPTQTVMFLTDTFSPEKQEAKNIQYVLLQDLDATIEEMKTDDEFEAFTLRVDALLRKKIADTIPEVFTYENSGVLIQKKFKKEDSINNDE